MFSLVPTESSALNYQRVAGRQKSVGSVLAATPQTVEVISK